MILNIFIFDGDDGAATVTPVPHRFYACASVSWQSRGLTFDPREKKKRVPGYAVCARFLILYGFRIDPR